MRNILPLDAFLRQVGPKEKVGLSKFLSLVLRHQPEVIGLELDAEGWADVDELLSKARRAGKALDLETLREIVAENDKQRFKLSADGRLIRANHGHSIEVHLGLEPTAPPPLLYHGTVERFLASIFARGLLKGQRQFVHLSADLETAWAVGARRGKPVVLEVAADVMAAEGLLFFRADNGVWLTDHVPASFLARMG